jgi:peptidoglycan/xylan/chitin deacetylase (PgdA/CDA1 family)
VAILAWHNVVAPGEGGRGDTSLHLDRRAFGRQLDRLAETHRIVPLGWLEGPAAGAEATGAAGDGRPRAILTFDDGYRGVLRHAIPELTRRGLPATVFVCPGLLGGEGFWWDRVAEGGGGLTAEVRDRAMEGCGGRLEQVLDTFAHGPVPPDYRPVDRDELRELAGAPGITLASHTWSHPTLPVLDTDELTRELARARRWLEEEVAAGDRLLDHLSAPYGRWSEEVVRAAARAGYRWLYRVEGGLAAAGVPVSGDAASRDEGAEGTIRVLPRINVPAGASVRGVELRASGVR